MSRGPGKWQRVILERLEKEEGFFLMDCLPDYLGRAPKQAELSALYRAGTLLEKAGGCQLQYVWRECGVYRRGIKRRRMGKYLLVYRPGIPIRNFPQTAMELIEMSRFPIRLIG